MKKLISDLTNIADTFHEHFVNIGLCLSKQITKNLFSLFSEESDKDEIEKKNFIKLISHKVSRLTSVSVSILKKKYVYYSSCLLSFQPIFPIGIFPEKLKIEQAVPVHKHNKIVYEAIIHNYLFIVKIL